MTRLVPAACVSLALLAGPPDTHVDATAQAPALDLFFRAAGVDERAAREALDEIGKSWKDGYAAMIVDMARLMRRAPSRREEPDLFPGVDEDPGAPAGARGDPFGGLAAPVRRDSIIRSRLIRFLEQQTRQRFGEDLNAWREWMWKLPYEPHPEYGVFKAAVYSQIDRRFGQFFQPGTKALIRLDEIDWGGVPVNGIPPLVSPKTIPASEAGYLRDGHIVFGVVVNAEARAYPKRILAWHEMAVDRIGGLDMTIVYCTLCGTVIPYESVAGGRTHRFGTSGLLYRSNKLMFDEHTNSLWSTLEGRPVVGPLAGSDLQLVSHASVTTTWGEWKAEHPATTVLSLDTGHKRDYSEGAAYRDYFSNDDLYFRVSHVDRRLKNKAEVLTFRVPEQGSDRQAVAIAADFLKRVPVHHFDVGSRRFVVVTTPRGANRVYAIEAGSPTFTAGRDGVSHLVDGGGQRWRVTEEALVNEQHPAARLPRVSAQRAFWFGWVAQFPDTILIK